MICQHCHEPGAPERPSGEFLHTACIHDYRYAEQNGIWSGMRKVPADELLRCQAEEPAAITTCKLCGATAADEVCDDCREARAQMLDRMHDLVSLDAITCGCGALVHDDDDDCPRCGATR